MTVPRTIVRDKERVVSRILHQGLRVRQADGLEGALRVARGRKGPGQVRRRLERTRSINLVRVRPGRRWEHQIVVIRLVRRRGILEIRNAGHWNVIARKSKLENDRCEGAVPARPEIRVRLIRRDDQRRDFAVHIDWAATLVYLPVPQSVHVKFPLSLLNVPAVHPVQVVRFPPFQYPVSHMHDPELVDPVPAVVSVDMQSMQTVCWT